VKFSQVHFWQPVRQPGFSKQTLLALAMSGVNIAKQFRVRDKKRDVVLLGRICKVVLPVVTWLNKWLVSILKVIFSSFLK